MQEQFCVDLGPKGGDWHIKAHQLSLPSPATSLAKCHLCSMRRDAMGYLSPDNKPHNILARLGSQFCGWIQKQVHPFPKHTVFARMQHTAKLVGSVFLLCGLQLQFLAFVSYEDARTTKTTDKLADHPLRCRKPNDSQSSTTVSKPP